MNIPIEVVSNGVWALTNTKPITLIAYLVPYHTIGMFPIPQFEYRYGRCKKMQKVDTIKTANIKTPKDGDLIPFEIKEIVKGTLSEMLDKETVDKWDHSNPSDPFILITCSNIDYGIMTKLIPLPVDEKGNEDMSRLNFRHTLAQIKSRYKQDLTVGMKITFRYNSEGRTFKMVV